MNQRFVSVALTGLMAALLVLGVVPGSAAPAAAYRSSLDSPQGLAVLADYAAMSAGGSSTAVSAGVVSTTSAVTTGSTAVVGGLSVGQQVLNSAVAATAVGILAAQFFKWGESAPPELTLPDAVQAGWVNGDNVLNQSTTAYGTMVVDTAYEILSAPAYGQSGQITYRYRCLYRSGSSQGTLPRLRALNASGQVISNNFTAGGCTLINQNEGTFAPATSWTTATAQVTGALARIVDSFATAQWIPEGAVGGQPPAVEPLGTVTSTVQCGTGPGDLHYVVESTLRAYSPGGQFEIPSPQCPAGEVVFGYGVTWTTGETTEDIVPWTATPEWVHSIPTEFPECLGSACDLTLWQTFSDSPALYCGVAAVGCPQWYTHVQSDPDTYECRWGSYTVSLGYCNVFRSPGTVTPNTPTQTDPKNGTRQSTGANPDTSLNLPVKPEPDSPFYSPQLPPEHEPVESFGECFRGGFGQFNPIEWVLTPIKCAFVWAFIPRTGFDVDSIKLAFGGTILGTLGGFLETTGGIFSSYNTNTDRCGQVLSASVGVFDGEALEVTTCDPIVLSVAPFVRGALITIIWIGAAFLAVDLVLRGFDIHIGAQKIADKLE